MNPTIAGLRAGLVRGAFETRHTLTNSQDLLGYVLPSVVFLVIMFTMRNKTVDGADVSMGAMALPSVLGMTVMFAGLMTVAQLLIVEREDGTLLRAKAVPNGMLGYLVGKVVTVSGMTVASLAIILVPGLFMFDGVSLDSLGAWLTLAWVLAVGLVATMPIGAVIGSLFSSPRQVGLIMLPLMGLIGISGIFYPITEMPGWLQSLAQVFPMYWLGLGMRSAMLPDAMAAVELGESWRHLQTLGVLGAWAVVGLAVAPVVLRRMARRESGSTVQARKEKAMQRPA